MPKYPASSYKTDRLPVFLVYLGEHALDLCLFGDVHVVVNGFASGGDDFLDHPVIVFVVDIHLLKVLIASTQ